MKYYSESESNALTLLKVSEGEKETSALKEYFKGDSPLIKTSV